MFAIVEIGGHQYKVAVKDVVQVHKIDAKEGDKIVETKVLLISDKDGKDVKIGKPFVDGAKVEATVVKHGRGDKIRVFKMKSKKRNQTTIGHRQDFTEIEITGIK